MLKSFNLFGKYKNNIYICGIKKIKDGNRM